MAVVVIDKAEGVIMVFGEKAKGIIGGEGVICDSRGGDSTGDGAEGGVVVVCCDAIARLKVDEFGHILIAVTSVEEFITCATLGEEWARSDGFSRVPYEEIDL